MHGPTSLAAIALLGTLRVASAQTDTDDRPLFADDTPLTFSIEGPFRQLGRDGSERPERPAILKYRDTDDREIVLDVDVRIRGRSRLEICSFPPLRLDFVREQLAGTVFAGQNRLKLVTLCRRSDAYYDYLRLEHEVYRMLNALTDRSFRVRWATVEYIETDRRRAQAFTQPAFFIEEDWEVAERLGLEVMEIDDMRMADLDAAHTALLSLFQFIIGNTDWSATLGSGGAACCHNGNVIGSPGRLAIVLPYDFDQSGLVDADYATPNPILPIRSVTQRLYRGYCPMNHEIDAAIALLNDRRDAVEANLASAAVSERARNRALEYLRESYAIVNDSERRQEEIFGNYIHESLDNIEGLIYTGPTLKEGPIMENMKNALEHIVRICAPGFDPNDDPAEVAATFAGIRQIASNALKADCGVTDEWNEADDKRFAEAVEAIQEAITEDDWTFHGALEHYADLFKISPDALTHEWNLRMGDSQ